MLVGLALAIVAALAASPAIVAAQTATSDAQFIHAAAADNLAEMELGRLAMQRASTDAVKQYGQRIASDHSQAMQELTPIAAKNGVPIPRDLEPTDRALRDRLTSLSGAEFDRTYMNEMVRDHTKAVGDFQREAQTAQDPAVRAFAAKTLPVLQEHLRLAQDISSRLAMAPSGSASALPATAVVPAQPWCGGAWSAASGSNFGICSK
jgi:putative membrane protein